MDYSVVFVGLIISGAAVKQTPRVASLRSSTYGEEPSVLTKCHNILKSIRSRTIVAWRYQASGHKTSRRELIINSLAGFSDSIFFLQKNSKNDQRRSTNPPTTIFYFYSSPFITKVSLFERGKPQLPPFLSLDAEKCLKIAQN